MFGIQLLAKEEEARPTAIQSWFKGIQSRSKMKSSGNEIHEARNLKL